MSNKNLPDWWDELVESDRLEPQVFHPGRGEAARQERKKTQQHKLVEVSVQDDSRNSFDFTYQATRHEEQWLLGSLGSFYEQRWIDDVLRKVKGGKEANVYLCQGDARLPGGLAAAKIYRPRMLRNLRNDHLYREGRADLDGNGNQITNHGMLHAMRKKTAYGKELLHASWIGHEFTTLQALHAAGADVPRPYASGENALLIGYIGDEQMDAPALSSVRLDRDEARPLYERIVRNIEIMLACDRVHGDLSAYNVLYWEGEITLIDFPQAIAPEQNPSAFRIFERDVQRICEYFTRQGVVTQPRRLAADLWTAYHHRLVPDVNPALLDAQDEQDVAYWKSISAQ